MKKTTFNPALLHRGRLPVTVSRRIFGHSSSDNANVSYLSDGDEGAAGEEAILLKKIQKSVTEQLATRATKDEMNNIVEQLKFLKKNEDGTGGFPIEALRSMADAEKGVMAIVAAQGLELQRLEQTLAAQPKDMSIRSQCAAYLAKNKATIDQIMGGTKALLEPFELQFRAAASPMLPSTVMSGGTTYIARTEVAPGINEILRAEPTFWDYIRKGTTGAATYVWINKKNPQGAAAFIAPGVYKPGVSFEVEAEISNAKKVAASEKMAIELLQDIDGFADWVETELRYKVMDKVNTTLMTGVLSSTVPAGIQTLSVAYATGLGLEADKANAWDAIKALVAQLRYARFKGKITVFMNPIDIANMVMTKAENQGQTFIPPVTGATIVEDQNIPLGYVQAAALDYYKILIYKAFSMTYGWENDDFTKNLVTVIGEMRLHQFHSENYDGFAVYDTIANITASLQATWNTNHVV